MRILCDENVRHSIYNLLVQEGHDVERVQDRLDIGDGDRVVIEYCREERRILLTNDDDFFAFDHHRGILFLDEQSAPTRTVVTAIQRVEEYLGTDYLTDTVVHVPDGWV